MNLFGQGRGLRGSRGVSTGGGRSLGRADGRTDGRMGGWAGGPSPLRDCGLFNLYIVTYMYV